jgi:hypothetical protein
LGENVTKLTENATQGEGAEETTAGKAEPLFRKRIGSTTYEVSVYFSETSKETFDEKILRMIRNEAEGQ